MFDKIVNLCESNAEFKNSIKNVIKIALNNNEYEIASFIAQMYPKTDVVETVLENLRNSYNRDLLMATITEYNIQFNNHYNYLMQFLSIACDNADIQTLDWIVENSDISEHISQIKRDDIFRIFKTACLNKKHEILEWILEKPVDLDYFADCNLGFQIIARHDYDMLIFLKSHGVDVNKMLETVLIDNQEYFDREIIKNFTTLFSVFDTYKVSVEKYLSHYLQKNFSFFVTQISRGNIGLIDIFKQYNIDVSNLLNKSLIETVTGTSRGNMINTVNSLIKLGADIKSVSFDKFLELGLCDVCKQFIDETNCVELFQHIMTSKYYYNHDIAVWIYDNYNGNIRISDFFSFLDKKILFETLLNCSYNSYWISKIISYDYKFFVDMYLKHNCTVRLPTSHLTKLQKNILDGGVIDILLFDPDKVDDMALYILYKKNNIRMFDILTNIYPNLMFEVKNSRIENYFFSTQTKSARKI